MDPIFSFEVEKYNNLHMFQFHNGCNGEHFHWTPSFGEIFRLDSHLKLCKEAPMDVNWIWEAMVGI